MLITTALRQPTTASQEVRIFLVHSIRKDDDFAAFFVLVLPVNYLLLARDYLLLACLKRDD